MTITPDGTGGGIVSGGGGVAAALNVAVQVVLALSATVPVVQPVPDQPAKAEPEAGVAVRTIEVPLL